MKPSSFFVMFTFYINRWKSLPLLIKAVGPVKRRLRRKIGRHTITLSLAFPSHKVFYSPCPSILTSSYSVLDPDQTVLLAVLPAAHYCPAAPLPRLYSAPRPAASVPPPLSPARQAASPASPASASRAGERQPPTPQSCSG